MAGRIVSTIISSLLSAQLNLQSVRRFIRRMEAGQVTSCKKSTVGDSIEGLSAGAVMRRIQLSSSKKQFFETIDSFASEAFLKGVTVLAFPEYNGIDLLGLIPGLRLINRILNHKLASVTSVKSATSSDEHGDSPRVAELLLKSTAVVIC